MAVSGNYTAIVQVKVSDTELEKQLKTVGSKTTIDIKVNADTKAIDNLKTTINNTSKEIKDYSSNSDTASQANEKISSSADKASKSTKSLGIDFVDTTAKVAKFGASTAVIGAFYSAIQEAKEAVTDFDDALTEFNKVSSLGEEQLGSYLNTLSELGSEVGRTRTEMLDSATMFVKSGFSEEDSAQLAKIAELYKNISDTQIDSGESSSFLVSQMKSFNFTANDTIKIIDSMNNIANNMAVGTNDLQIALEKSGSALGTLGNSFEESIALVESGTSIMQGQASKVGRGLRSIGVELSKMATESDTLSDASGKVSVAFKDENGELKNTYEILNDLYPQWQQLNEEQKTQLAQSVAGKLLCRACIGLINGEEEIRPNNKIISLNCDFLIMVA